MALPSFMGHQQGNKRVQENLEGVAVWEVKTNGKPIYEARMDIASSADTFDFYAGIAPAVLQGSGTSRRLCRRLHRHPWRRAEPLCLHEDRTSGCCWSCRGLELSPADLCLESASFKIASLRPHRHSPLATPSSTNPHPMRQLPPFFWAKFSRQRAFLMASSMSFRWG